MFFRGLDLSKYIANKEESRPVYDLFAVCNCSGDHCQFLLKFFYISLQVLLMLRTWTMVIGTALMMTMYQALNLILV